MLLLDGVHSAATLLLLVGAAAREELPRAAAAAARAARARLASRLPTRLKACAAHPNANCEERELSGAVHGVRYHPASCAHDRPREMRANGVQDWQEKVCSCWSPLPPPVP